MANTPLLISNNLTVNFHPKPDIRRCQDRLEELLCNEKTSFLLPAVFPVPDGADPTIPVFVFNTKHGFAQLVVTQSSISINTRYSEEFQADLGKAEEYLLKHLHTLFSLLDEKIIGRDATFCGLASVVQASLFSNDTEAINNILKNNKINADTTNIFDVEIKYTYVIDETYFNNITTQNFRINKNSPWPMPFQRISRAQSIGRGIQLIMDFNDRYSYNEKDEYFSSQDKCTDIIKTSFKYLKNEITKLT